MVPRTSNHRETYNLRPKGIPIPKTRTQRSSHSFLPQTVRDWNTLDADLQNSSKKEHFTNQLKNVLHIVKPKKSFLHAQEPSITHHTRIRLGLSHLRAQLYHYNIVEDPYCPNCPSTPETATHFFLKCPKNSLHRNEMFQNCQQAIDNDLRNIKSSQILKVLLEGNDEMYDNETEKRLFNVVHTYISKTERFVFNNDSN